MAGAVVVLGGAAGLGGAVYAALAEACDGPAWITYRSERAAAESLAASVPDGQALRCDVAVASDLESLATAVAASSDSVSVLVHCAVDAVNGPLTEIGVDRLNAALAVSATSLLGAVTAFGPMLVPGSAVIYLTSVGGQRVVRDYGAVGVAKAAGEALVRYLASELAVGGVRVNAVSAGPVDTGALQIMTGDVAAVLASSARRSPMRRNVTTAEVSDMVVMLTGPRSTAVTGQIVTVDTGLFLA